eukprot:Rhum_TRINITY_DN7975_c0_g1::Rhum_TRINITY_DN7975_c0_g1_i1::g.25162::m.25162
MRLCVTDYGVFVLVLDLLYVVAFFVFLLHREKSVRGAFLLLSSQPLDKRRAGATTPGFVVPVHRHLGRVERANRRLVRHRGLSVQRLSVRDVLPHQTQEPLRRVVCQPHKRRQRVVRSRGPPPYDRPLRSADGALTQRESMALLHIFEPHGGMLGGDWCPAGADRRRGDDRTLLVEEKLLLRSHVQPWRFADLHSTCRCLRRWWRWWLRRRLLLLQRLPRRRVRRRRIGKAENRGDFSVAFRNELRNVVPPGHAASRSCRRTLLAVRRLRERFLQVLDLAAGKLRTVLLPLRRLGALDKLLLQLRHACLRRGQRRLVAAVRLAHALALGFARPHPLLRRHLPHPCRRQVPQVLRTPLPVRRRAPAADEDGRPHLPAEEREEGGHGSPRVARERGEQLETLHDACALVAATALLARRPQALQRVQQRRLVRAARQRRCAQLRRRLRRLGGHVHLLRDVAHDGARRVHGVVLDGHLDRRRRCVRRSLHDGRVVVTLHAPCVDARLQRVRHAAPVQHGLRRTRRRRAAGRSRDAAEHARSTRDGRVLRDGRRRDAHDAPAAASAGARRTEGRTSGEKATPAVALHKTRRHLVHPPPSPTTTSHPLLILTHEEERLRSGAFALRLSAPCSPSSRFSSADGCFAFLPFTTPSPPPPASERFSLSLDQPLPIVPSLTEGK